MRQQYLRKFPSVGMETAARAMIFKHCKALALCFLNFVQLMRQVESNTEEKYTSHQEIPPEMQYSKLQNDADTPVKYPNNHKILRAQLERFEKYYKCLNESKMTPVVHYVLSGTSVSLHCEACISPQGNSIQWQYANKATNFTKYVVRTDNTVNKHSETLRSTQTEDGLTLVLYGLSMKESGHYNCLQDGNVITPHLVQVANSTENLYRVKPTAAPRGPYPSPEFNITELGVQIWFEWSDWSACSRCDRIGKRTRIGICMVSPFKNNNSTDAQILGIFPKGIPCRSNLLPASIRNHPKVQFIDNEYMAGFCKEKCPRSKQYVLKDTGGVLLKKISNLSDPLFTLMNRLPHISPPVKSSALYLKQWDTAHVQCPGSDYNNAPVHWRLGLNLMLVENERVHLTPIHILVINDLGISDSNVYTCWQRSRLVGIVRLIVSQPIRLSFEEQLNALVLIIIIISFIIITLRILRAYLKRRRVVNRATQ